VPASLPPSLIDETEDSEKPRYVTSSSGHTAHPDDIAASCKTLQEHIKRTQEEAAKVIREWEGRIKGRELAEKRRVAPGWLDREEKILEPMKVAIAKNQGNLLDGRGSRDERDLSLPAMSPNREGEELDRAFGGLGIK